MIQPISMVVGGMVLGFLVAKAILLIRAIRAHDQSSIVKLNDASRETAEMMLILSEQDPSLLARRTNKLLTLWIDSGSTTQVERTLDHDTEAYDLAYQASYALPKILIWAIPVLGFIGTVLGIGEAIGSFESFITASVEDFNVLRDGLSQVTEGLGTAFDTTFLALTISLVVMLPLTLLERLEQRLLTKIDLDLRNKILEALPETDGIDEATLERAISAAFTTHLPNPEVLVEPAKVYAERATQTLVEHLQPLHQMADEAIAGIESARINIEQQAEGIRDALNPDVLLVEPAKAYAEKAAQNLVEHLKPLHKMADEAIAGIESARINIEQQAEGIRDALNPDVLVEPAKAYAEKAAQNLVEHLQPLHQMADEAIAGIESARINVQQQGEEICDALDRSAKGLGDSVDALQPLLEQLNKFSSLSSELAQLQASAHLHESLSELNSTLNLLRNALIEVGRPRKIVLVEEN